MRTVSAITPATLTVWRAKVIHQRVGRAAASSELGMNVMVEPRPDPGQPCVISGCVWRDACQGREDEFLSGSRVNVRASVSVLRHGWVFVNAGPISLARRNFADE